ncbi:MAG: nucleoside 2-deoxyribosyltransferase [Streptosporangiaceae bacterium]|nr:nucleoside 2-deoxyribosyltransferase [Streptosporangiaceae bacterium]
MALFYVAHRLFAAHDRAVGAYLADRLAQMAGDGNVFLPFCDTDEENLVADCKGRRLFELDRARLRRITGMIAVLHGPSLDDGVCMEIGFAAALGVPVVLASTDFQTYTPVPGGCCFAFAEPLLETIAVTVVRAHHLGPPLTHAVGNRFRAFLSQNLPPIRAIATRAAETLLSNAPARPPASQRSRTDSQFAYLEPSPYFADDMWSDIAQALRTRGWTVHIAQRFLARTGIAEAARADWAAVTTASLAVVDARGPETPPGAALIIGACAATGRPVLAAHPGTWPTLANGREPNWRNLMIQYAVSARFCGIAEFTAALDRLPCPET